MEPINPSHLDSVRIVVTAGLMFVAWLFGVLVGAVAVIAWSDERPVRDNRPSLDGALGTSQ